MLGKHTKSSWKKQKPKFILYLLSFLYSICSTISYPSISTVHMSVAHEVEQVIH